MTTQDNYILFRLDKIDASLSLLTATFNQLRAEMANNFNRLEESISKVTTVVESAVTLIKGLAQEVRDAKDDPVKVEELATRMEAQAANLAAVVAENTPITPVGSAKPRGDTTEGESGEQPKKGHKRS